MKKPRHESPRFGFIGMSLRTVHSAREIQRFNGRSPTTTARRHCSAQNDQRAGGRNRSAAIGRAAVTSARTCDLDIQAASAARLPDDARQVDDREAGLNDFATAWLVGARSDLARLVVRERHVRQDRRRKRAAIIVSDDEWSARPCHRRTSRDREKREGNLARIRSPLTVHSSPFRAGPTDLVQVRRAPPAHRAIDSKEPIRKPMS